MDNRQTRTPNAGLDILRLTISTIVANQLCQLVDGKPLQGFRNLARYRFFEKPDPHSAGDHPIAHSPVQRAQVVTNVLLEAKCINRLHWLWHCGPLRLRRRLDSERITAIPARPAVVSA